MMKKILLSSFILIGSLPLSAQWTTVGQPDFANHGAAGIFSAVSPAGEPYVVYKDQISNIVGGRVMKFNGSNWVLVGPSSFSAGDILTPTMAFDKYGTPYVAYSDRANCHKATVLKFDGSNWISVGISGFSPGPASYTSIAFDKNNTAYVAFLDVGSCVYNSAPNGYRASVMKFDGTNWVYVGMPGFSSSTGLGGVEYVSLAIDANGTLYVAYTDHNSNFKAIVMTFDGTNWVNVGAGVISAGQTGSPSMVLDSHNVPYVAYVDVANSGKATVMKFDGSNWILVGMPAFTPGNAEYTSLTIDNNDKLYLSFKDYSHYKKGASVMTFDGNNWIYVGSPGFSDSTVLTTSLAIDKNKGILYAAYETVYNEYSFDPNNPPTYNGTIKKYELSTGVKNSENESFLNIYPNPGTGVFQINYSAQEKGKLKLNITDVKGKLIYNENISQFNGELKKNIDLGKQAKGIYFIEVISGNDKRTKKIIID